MKKKKLENMHPVHFHLENWTGLDRDRDRVPVLARVFGEPGATI